jgi:hypothetical protein
MAIAGGGPERRKACAWPRVRGRQSPRHSLHVEFVSATPMPCRVGKNRLGFEGLPPLAFGCASCWFSHDRRTIGALRAPEELGVDGVPRVGEQRSSTRGRSCTQLSKSCERPVDATTRRRRLGRHDRGRSTAGAISGQDGPRPAASRESVDVPRRPRIAASVSINRTRPNLGPAERSASARCGMAGGHSAGCKGRRCRKR